MTIPPTLRREFEGGYRPSDDPPGLEERCYQLWLAERDGRGSTQDQPEGPGNPHAMMGREQTARDLLDLAISTNAETGRGLKELSEALPVKLPPLADVALRRLLHLYLSHQ